MVQIFTESTLAQAKIDWLKDLDYAYASGPDIAFDGERSERSDYLELLPEGRVRDSLLSKLMRGDVRVSEL